MTRVLIAPRHARLAACLLAVFAAASPTRAQTADELRPSVEEGGGQEEAPAEPLPIRGKITTLEANPIEAEEIVRRRKSRAALDDPYAPLGLRLGGLTVFPSLGVAGAATDNVRRTDKQREDDVGLRLRPAMRVESDWIRHSFTAQGSGDFTFYEKETDFDDREADAFARLRLDVRHATELEFESTYALAESSASDREVPDAAVQNRRDHNFGGFARLSHHAGLIGVELRGGASRQLYEDVKLANGGTEDNADRNYVQPEFGLRLSYEPTPAFRPFVEVAYTPRFHDKSTDRNGLKRDSDGYDAGLGVAFDVSELWSGEMALIYTLRDYEDPSLESVGALGLSGDVTWRPTVLTTVRLSAGTRIEESSSTEFGGSRNYDARIDVSHAFRENVTASAGAGIEYDDAEGDNDDLTTRSRLGLAWQINPWFAWTAGYDFTWFDSSAPGSDYRENRVSAGFEIRR